jgi:type II secretory pathway component PulC
MKSFLWLLCFIFLSLFFAAYSLSANSTGKDYSIILKSNIFSQPVPPPPKPVASILKPVEPPSLDKILTVKGIFYFSDSGSKAIIHIFNKNTDDLYSEGDMVENAKILKINKYSVSFQYLEKTVELGMDNSMNFPDTANTSGSSNPLVSSPQKNGINLNNIQPGISPKIMPAQTVDANETVGKLMSDSKLMGMVNVTPEVNESGKVSGFLVSNLPSNSLPVQLGLQNGDVIQSVNGVAIDSLATGFQVYNNIMQTQTKVVTVDVLRNNQPVVLTYHLK